MGCFLNNGVGGIFFPSVSQQVERIQLIAEPNVLLLETGGAVKL